MVQLKPYQPDRRRRAWFNSLATNTVLSAVTHTYMYPCVHVSSAYKSTCTCAVIVHVHVGDRCPADGLTCGPRGWRLSHIDSAGGASSTYLRGPCFNSQWKYMYRCSFTALLARLYSHTWENWKEAERYCLFARYLNFFLKNRPRGKPPPLPDLTPLYLSLRHKLCCWVDTCRLAKRPFIPNLYSGRTHQLVYLPSSSACDGERGKEKWVESGGGELTS